MVLGLGMAAVGPACGGAPVTPERPLASTPATVPGASASAVPANGAAPVTFVMPDGVGPRAFRVLGPFRNVAGPGKNARPGLDFDYLTSLGGEAGARVEAGTTVSFEGQALLARDAALSSASALDLHALFGGSTDSKTAYAYAEWTLPAPVRALALFGSDDAAQIWHNGHLVHRVARDRGLVEDSDRFELSLDKGPNRLLIKVDNGSGGWGFALRVLGESAQVRFRAIEARKHMESFDPAPVNGEYLLDQSFPELAWTHPAAAEGAVGSAAPIVHWYGPDLAPAERPGADGQYTAVVETRTLDGYPFRRMLAFAKIAPDARPSFSSPPTHELPVIDAGWPFGVQLNTAQREELSRHFWLGLSQSLHDGPDSAVAALALTRLASAQPTAGEPLWLSSGFIDVAEKELALRMALERRKPAPLRPPDVLATPAPELATGSEAQAGMRPGSIQKIRAVAAGWAKDDAHPFVVLVARRGRVFFHEAYNGFRKDSTFYPASIGKSIAALTFARAVDQGLLGFDQPVGSVLPDWTGERTSKLSFRNCFNHVSGLTGHASHGGMFNPYLDNALFVEDEAFASPATHFRYNGDDMDLAGKALELVTGRSIWRLLYEGMIEPFGEPVHQLDLGFGGAFTATYLAKVGEMILQDGAYGHHRFYKPGFLASLLPRRIIESAPGLDDAEIEAGIGLTWMTDPPGPRDKGVLGRNVIGHGASSGTTWRIDPDHDLVIVVGRDGFGDARTEESWQTKLARTIADGIPTVPAPPRTPSATP